MYGDTILVTFRGHRVAAFHRPVLPFTTEEGAMAYFSDNKSLLKPGGSMYPCPSCRGKGKVIDKDDYDIVEGYKQAAMINCQSCNGTGTCDKYAFKAACDRLTDDISSQIAAVDEVVSDLKEALSTLTLKQFTTLSEAFGYGLRSADESTIVHDVKGTEE